MRTAHRNGHPNKIAQIVRPDFSTPERHCPCGLEERSASFKTPAAPPRYAAHRRTAATRGRIATESGAAPAGVKRRYPLALQLSWFMQAPTIISRFSRMQFLCHLRVAGFRTFKRYFRPGYLVE